MAQSYWPFSGVDATETQWSQLFRRLQSTGVWGDPGDTQCQVAAATGLNLTVKAGYALVRGHMYYNSSDLTVTLVAGEAQARIDIIVLRLDPTANTITAAIVKGTASASPVAPALSQTDADVYELELARIAVAASASSIVSGNITDTRQFMGLVYGTWTTLQRPTSPRLGQPGFNSTLGYHEFWNGTTWKRNTVPDTIDAATVGGRHFLDGTTTPSGGLGVNEDIYFQYTP